MRADTTAKDASSACPSDISEADRETARELGRRSRREQRFPEKVTDRPALGAAVAAFEAMAHP